MKYNFTAARQYDVSWSRFDNTTEKHTVLAGESTFRLPGEMGKAEEGSYSAAQVRAGGDERKTVTVYRRKKNNAAEVAGIERKW